MAKGQSPSISFASSFYKTASGAIGPYGIVATSNFDLELYSTRTIILDSAIIRGFKVWGDGIIIPTNKEGHIEFSIRVITHQKDSVWYNGEMEHKGITVAARVAKSSSHPNLQVHPAVVLYLRTSNSSYVIVKETFDREQSQYNK
jgi:hypothetical protein